jgi:hypothetical protein
VITWAEINREIAAPRLANAEGALLDMNKKKAAITEIHASTFRTTTNPLGLKLELVMNPRRVPFGASPSFALSFKISSMLSLIIIYWEIEAFSFTSREQEIYTLKIQKCTSNVPESYTLSSVKDLKTQLV